MATIDVTSTTARVYYTGNGATVAFVTGFVFYANADLLVYVDNVLKTITTHYTVTGAGVGAGGTVTFLTAPANATAVAIVRAATIESTTHFPIGGPFNTETLNLQVNKLTIFSQENRDKLARTVRQADGDGSTFVGTLPATAALRASKALAFDASGNMTVSTLTVAAIEAGSTAAAASAVAAAASAALAATAKTNAETAETNAETAETNASLSAIAAAAAAASGLFAYIEDKTANFTVIANTDNSTLYKADTSGGSIVVTLPSIATAGEGERYGFLRSSALNALTLARDGSDTINGVASNYTVPAVAGEILLIVADVASPNNWIIIRWALSQADGTSLSQSGNTLSINPANTNTFTAPQRSTPLADNDGSFDLNARQDFTCTPAGAVALTFTNKPTGQTGKVYLDNSGAYAITRAANVLASSDFNSTVSVAGKYIVSYWSIDGTTVGLVATPALS